MIAITSDTDWAPVEVIEYMLSILDERGIRATFFCTDRKAKSTIAAHSGHELAIHPNFRSGKDERNTLSKLLRVCPNAKGVRSHCSYFHTKLTEIYEKLGIEYDSNWFVPQGVRPFMLFNGILEIPMCFMDNLAFDSKHGFSSPLMLEPSALPSVFNFHPVHVFLNTESPERYLKAKPHYRDSSRLRKFRNKGPATGACDYLLQLLELIRKQDLEICTMHEINVHFRKELGP